jgi:hypothetical protein
MFLGMIVRASVQSFLLRRSRFCAVEGWLMGWEVVKILLGIQKLS